MKTMKQIALLVTLLVITAPAFSQKGKVVLNTNEIPEETHVHLDDFPTNQLIPMIPGWGGMAVEINATPAGTDFTPLLKGLENDLCQVPHWGYVIHGAIKISYEDGSSEVFRAGEAYYMKPGHTGIVLEDLKLVSFSPEKGMQELSEHLEKRVKQLQSQNAGVK